MRCVNCARAVSPSYAERASDADLANPPPAVILGDVVVCCRWRCRNMWRKVIEDPEGFDL